MKSFYEMWRILEGLDYDAWLTSGYDDDYDISFSKVLGEDDKDAPFSLEVDIENGEWTNRGGIWVLGYIPDGSENPASQPIAYTAGEKGWPAAGTEFMKPGRKLELLPASIKDKAIEWVDKMVKWEMEHYKPDDPRDYDDDREPYNPDPDGHGYWDRYWSTGPGRDPD